MGRTARPSRVAAAFAVLLWAASTVAQEQGQQAGTAPAAEAQQTQPAAGSAALRAPPLPAPAPEGTWQALMDELGIPHAPLESYYAPAPEPPPASEDGWAFQEVQAGGAPGGQPPDLLSPAAEGSNSSEWGFVELPAQAQPQAAAPQAAVSLPSGSGEAQPAENATGRAAEPLPSPGPAAEAPQYAVAAPPPERLCWVQGATDFKGGDLGPGNSTCCQTAADCCNTCWDRPSCGAWTYRTADATCFTKGPAGWVRTPRQPGLTSGLVTSVTVTGFNVSMALSGSAAAALGAEELASAPLQGTTVTGWLPPPPGYEQGKCYVMPNSNVKGDDLDQIFNTTADACCDACDANPACTVWIYCGEQGGCNNVFYDYASCGLRHQDVPPNQLNESTIMFWGRGTANITEYPPGYTVPWTSGYVLSHASSGSSSSAGAIAGGIAGAVAAVLLAAGFLLWRRRRRRRQPAKQLSDYPNTFGQKLSDNLNELETAWHTSGGSGSKGTGPPGGSSSNAAAGTAGTPDTAMVLHGGESGPATPGTSGSGPIPELPFATALLTSSDYKLDADPSTGKPILLGSGHFANVYRGVYGAEPAAIKVIKEPGLLDRASLLQEVAILKSCRSQHLVSFLGASLSPEEVVIVTELMAGGTLWRALKTGKVTFYRRGLKIAIDVARGLHYLHARNIVHLDLKSPNVLLSEHGRAKVADVGLARMIPATQSYLSGGNVAAGTWPWAAPEQLFGQRCTSKADIYGYGVVLWEICTQGVTPVRGHMREVRVPEECPQEVAGLIAACMSSVPEQRPSAEKIIAALSPLLAAGALRQQSPSGQTPPAAAAQRVGSVDPASPLAQQAGQHTGGSAAGQLPTGPSDRMSTPAVTDAPAQQPSPVAASQPQEMGAAQSLQPPQQQQPQERQAAGPARQPTSVPLSKSITV